MDKNHLVEEEGEGKSLNFIEQIIEEELAEGKNGRSGTYSFPAGTERVLAYRTCNLYMLELRIGNRIPGKMQPPF